MACSPLPLLNPSADYYLVSSSFVIGDKLGPAAVLVVQGQIAAITTPAVAHGSGVRVVDVGALTVMAGLVDSHVHMNEPGRTEWEGFWTATQAAASGGVTTVVDMPLNSMPVTTTLPALEAKIRAMEDQCWVDVGLLGGIIPGNTAEVGPLLDRGVLGFKCFMVHSGIDDFPHCQPEDIRAALTTLKAKGAKAVFMFHAEDPHAIDIAAKLGGDPTRYATFLASRPPSAEVAAITQLLHLIEEQPYPAHIVHLAAAPALPLLRSAKAKGLPLTAETTFHYLYFESASIPDGATLYKCCPPIRERDNREQLWGALEEGLITQVVSDHSPCTIDLKMLKEGNYMAAWGGIASLQLGLPILWTGMRQRGLGLPDLTRLCAHNTAQLVNLGTKGAIEVGRDADFVVWDPSERFTVSKEMLRFKNKASPYEGQQLFGVVKQTILRGQTIFKEGQLTTPQPTGQWLLRDEVRLKK